VYFYAGYWENKLQHLLKQLYKMKYQVAMRLPPFFTANKGKSKKLIAYDFDVPQTNAYNSCILKSTETKQRFLNSFKVGK